MPNLRTVYGNNQNLVRDFSQTLKLVNARGDSLDLTASFKDGDITFEPKRQVNIFNVPGRTVMFDGGSQELPIEFSFSVINTSLTMQDQEMFFYDVESFWRESPGREVSIYWLDDISGVSEYKAFLPYCKLVGFPQTRGAGKRLRDEPIGIIKTKSRSTRWIRLFPGDPISTTFAVEGSTVINIPTNDDSSGIIARRESDEVAVMVITDQGNLLLAGGLKEWQDLSAY